MRGFFGAALVVAGIVLVYLFGALGIAAAKATSLQPGVSVAALPFQVLGANYPKDALCIAGGLFAAGWGLYLLLVGASAAAPVPAAPMAPARDGARPARFLAHTTPAPVTTGTYARGFCLLALGACAAWAIAALGAATGARTAVIGGFVALAGLALLEALVLGILSCIEKGKPVIVLVLAWVLFVGALGFGLAGLAMGG
jgi:hypothetical protein